MQRAIQNTINKKTCTKCEETKKLSDFRKDKSKKDGLGSWCKDCSTKDNKRWKMANPDKAKEIVRIWKFSNAKRWRDYKKVWNKAHPVNTREHARRQHVKNLNTPKGRLANRLSCSIRKSIKKGLKAGRPWEDLVGYTVDQLKKHLEKKFEPGMAWENYGKAWEIDHKIPIAVFNFEKPEHIDFKLCWAIKNLRPLEVSLNRRKNAKIDKPFQPSLKFNVI